MTSTRKFTKTLADLDNLANSEFIKSKTFDDFTTQDLKQMKSDDYRLLCKKKIEQLSDQYLKVRENLSDQEVTRYDQSEVKQLTTSLTKFRDDCEKKGLSVREFEEEGVNFITDKYKRFFFTSKWAQRLYKLNNGIASTSLGYWGYRSLGVLGSTNRFLLSRELLKSTLPIAYFTGVTCRFWAYITSPLPTLSKFFDGASHIALSPIWLGEYVINKLTGPFFRATPLKTEVPLNITGHVASGSDLTWDKLTHTFEFVKNMTRSWNDS